MKILFFSLLILFGFSSCGIADLRTADIKADRQSFTDHEKAEYLLANAVKKQGMDKVSAFQTYEIIGSDHWKGILGSISNVWKWKKEKIALRFAIGDFDGQVEVLEGRKKGLIAGIQSWDYYEIENKIYRSNVATNERIRFALAAYHYYFEIANRLQKAPFIRYYGTGEIDGKPMEKVLASWGNKKTKDYDQYIIWIGTESGLIEAITHTIRDTYLPFSGFIYSSARFDDFRKIDGVWIPFVQTVQIKEPKDKISKYIHQFTVESFRWDTFPIAKLRPSPNLKPIGDDKRPMSLEDALKLDNTLDGVLLID